jgi:hypothetical protein
LTYQIFTKHLYFYLTERLEAINFYLLDKAIQSCRIYSQKKEIKTDKITFCQWLVIKVLMENLGLFKQNMAEKAF